MLPHDPLLLALLVISVPKGHAKSGQQEAILGCQWLA